jgi:hypothetical protein
MGSQEISAAAATSFYTQITIPLVTQINGRLLAAVFYEILH